MRSARTSLFWRTWFVPAVLACTLATALEMSAQQAPEPCSAPSTSSSFVMWQRIPGHLPDPTGAIQGLVCDTEGRPLPGVRISSIRPGASFPPALTNSEGVFRLLNVQPGNYQLRAEKDGYSSVGLPNTQLTNGELLTVELLLSSLAPPAVSHRVPGRSAWLQRHGHERSAVSLHVLQPVADIAGANSMATRRYTGRNAFRCSELFSCSLPLVGAHAHLAAVQPTGRLSLRQGALVRSLQSQSHQGRLNRSSARIGSSTLPATSLTGIDLRRLPVPSGVTARYRRTAKDSSAKASSSLLRRASFSRSICFKGTPAFDLSIGAFASRPQVNLNFLQTRERGLVNVDPRGGHQPIR